MTRKTIRMLSGLILLVLVAGFIAPANASSVSAASTNAGTHYQTVMAPSDPLTTAFTYQGRLTDDGQPANGMYDFRFWLCDSNTGLCRVNAVEVWNDAEDVQVTDGIFTVSVNFGSGKFDGNARWLEIGVQHYQSINAYTILTPRQPLNAAPYAQMSSTALFSANTDLLDGLNSTSFLSTSGGSVSNYLNVGTSTTSGMLSVTAASNRRAIYLTGGASIQLSSLTSKWNLPTSNGTAAVLSVISSDWDTAGGFGLITGANVNSPIVWLYSSTTRNAFTVAKKNYAGTGPDISTIDDYLVPLFQVRENGNVGIGTVDPLAKLDVRGTTRTQVVQITGGADFAEPFQIFGAENLLPGMLVMIDPEHAGQLRIAVGANNHMVAGCVSGAGGIQPGLVMQQEGTLASGAFPVAMSGRVYCLADASYGPIHPGDLLTSSDTPGHIMLVSDYSLAQGAIIGKAMSVLEQGLGLVLVLVSLQ